MVEELRSRVGNLPLAPEVRRLLAEALANRDRARVDLSRLAEIAAYVRSIRGSKTTPAYERILRGWAMDLIRQVPSMPGNSDWRDLMTFLHDQPEDKAMDTMPLKWARSPTTWRQEWVAGLGQEGDYMVVEQPGQGLWSVNFYDQQANIYAVNGMALSGSLAEAKAACERDAAERMSERSRR